MSRKWAADFETTVDEKDCRVWAYALCEVGDPDNFYYGKTIDEMMEWLENDKDNHILYFHNLKFDGNYILSWLYKNGFEWVADKKDRADRTFTTLITDMGQFFKFEIWFRAGKKPNKLVIQDSLKILNFSVEQIAKDFDLPIRKLELDYKAKREVGHELTQHEVDYIRNDVEIMSRALDIMFVNGLTKLTIASDALTSFKEMCPNFKTLFPEIDLGMDEEIRLSYKGGFTYLNPKYKGKTTGAGVVFDVNSLYPSVMAGNNPLPVGYPIFFEGEYEKDFMYPLYVQRFTCSFKLKKGKIPSIQLKHNYLFAPNEYIESSDGDIVTMTLTSVDMELFFEQYDVEHLSFEGGYKFQASVGIFDKYVNHWTEQKIQAKKDGNSAMYRISKLMLNSLYGKFGLNPKSRLKMPKYNNKTGLVDYQLLDTEERKPIYVAMASFITSYARKKTILTSQMIRDFTKAKYDDDRYIYSDTDSIHAILTQEDVNELSELVDIDDYKLGAWKLESQFQRGKYLRQKCYIEEFNGEINVTVAGLPKKLSKCINFENFNYGYTTESMTDEEVAKYGKKLTYKRVEGGVLLTETEFTIK